MHITSLGFMHASWWCCMLKVALRSCDKAVKTQDAAAWMQILSAISKDLSGFRVGLCNIFSKLGS